MPTFRRLLNVQKQALLEIVPVEINENYFLSESIRNSVSIDVIHDGNWIPEGFLKDQFGQSITMKMLEKDYIRERDWGASIVAQELASLLGVSTFARVNVARVLLDFGRFPGSTPPNAEHLNRFAINYPFSQLLSYSQKKKLLEEIFDQISNDFEAHLSSRQLKIAIHTYDQHNTSGTERPAVSLLTRTLGYQNNSEMPEGLFDPLYPDMLLEFTSDRVLRDRISLTLEKRGISVAHNYPYLLPEGSLEVRYQVWSFFRSLRNSFLQEFPASKGKISYKMVWEMLLDTNLRSSESEALRSFLHMYRRASDDRANIFSKAAEAYENIKHFAHQRHDALIHAYRFSTNRASSLAIEVRKDLICELDQNGLPLKPRYDNIQFICNALAEAISRYYKEDIPGKISTPTFLY